MKRLVCTNAEFVTAIADSYTQQLATKQDNAMTDLFQDKLSGYSVELLTPVTLLHGYQRFGGTCCVNPVG